MRKRTVYYILYATAVMLSAASCSTWKDFSYLQDADNFENLDIYNLPEIRVRKGDVIDIFVSSRNPESSQPFNLTASANTSSTSVGAGGNLRILGYQVDEFGDIEFPQLGIIHCEGMTKCELSNFIKSELIKNDYLKDPIVTIEFENLNVTVLGEVNNPGSYPMKNDHTTLLEAIGMAGDLSVYGRRDKVAVIREIDGKRTIVYHDLRSKELFNSPRYYLQQNDIVYVEPNKYKSSQSNVSIWTQPGLWLSGLSSVMSIVTFIKLLQP